MQRFNHRSPTRIPSPRRSVICSIIGIANPHSVPTESRWHPPPATAVADADSGGEQVSMMEVMKVSEVVPEVMKVSEAVSWKVRAMTESMYAPRSAGHAKAMHAAEAVHAARAVHATKTAH